MVSHTPNPGWPFEPSPGVLLWWQTLSHIQIHTHAHTLPQGSRMWLAIHTTLYYCSLTLNWRCLNNCVSKLTQQEVFCHYRNQRCHSDPSGICAEFSFCSHTFFDEPKINYLDLTLINSPTKTCKFVLQYLLVLRLNWVQGTFFCEFFWEKRTCQMPKKKKIKLLWCQKAQKVLERVIKVDQFKLAGFTDKWFLPL